METMMNEPVWSRVAEVELIYRSVCKTSERPKVCSAREIYDLLLYWWNPDKIDLQEQFKVVYLNMSNRVLAISDISTGGITGTIADPRLLLTIALKTAATSIVLAHNHPSGHLRPSGQDEVLTQKVKAAATFLEIKVLDHIIVTSEGFYSFADNGLL